MSVTKNNEDNTISSKLQQIKESTYRFITSIQFTIVLLSLIAVSSIAGTLIKQKAPVEEYLSLYPEGIYRIIRLFGLDDIYHAPWFYALLVLFAINLILCTLRRLSRLIKTKKRIILPEEDDLKNMPVSFTVNGKENQYVVRMLKRRYRATREETQGAVFEKGRLSQYGSLIIHAGIIITLIGSLTGLLFGYKGFMVLRKGEVKDHLTTGGRHGKIQPLGFSIRCKDFAVAFYPGGEPKDYVTTVEIIENNKRIMEKPIRVNHPLSYRGLRFYQATYGNKASFLFTIGQERVTLREREVYRKGPLSLMVIRFERQIHDFGPGVLVAYLDREEPKTIWFLRDVQRLKEQKIAGIPISLNEIHEDFFTGLEVSRDPGVWIVWTGFVSILFGLFANFFIYDRKIYLRNTADGIIVAGICKKNHERFREEFARIEKEINCDDK